MNLNGNIIDGKLNFPGAGSFTRPTTADIFSYSTGPFAPATTKADETGKITVTHAAGFNRSTLLSESTDPGPIDQYYKTTPTNHYSRIIHAVNTDGKGFAFPYDDVKPTDAPNQSGKIEKASPGILTVSTGGRDAKQ